MRFQGYSNISFRVFRNEKSCFLIMAFMAVGCASFSEIRKSEPVKNVFIPNESTDKIANYIFYDIKGSDHLFPVIANDNKDYFIMISSPPGLRGGPIIINYGELSFKHKNKGTEITLRMNNYFKPNDGATISIWNFVIKYISAYENNLAISGEKQ
jgi:hypothetical protein